MSAPVLQPSPTDTAYQAGRRAGLALAALALSLVAFLNLLGMEKSLLAIVLAILAMRGADTVLPRTRAALVIAGIHLISIAVIIVVFHDKLAQLLRLLYELG